MPVRLGFLESYSLHGAEPFRAFFCLISHYWHFECRGLQDDDEVLRRVSRCSQKDWPEVKKIVFGEFFIKDENGLWQNLNFKQEREEIIKEHKRRAAATAAARIKRLSGFKSKKATEAVKVAKNQSK